MYNILVVDDDKEIVGAIEIYLKNEGHNVIKAYNGEEALKKIKENEIHLINIRRNKENKNNSCDIAICKVRGL